MTPTITSTAKPCRNGHIAERRVSDGRCVECFRLSSFVGITQARVCDLVSAGYLRESAPGVFAQPTEGDQHTPQDATQEADSDVATMPQEFATAVDNVLAPVPDHALGSLTSVAISVAAGEGDMQSLVARFVTASGDRAV
jgi:hypothetical protein